MTLVVAVLAVGFVSAPVQDVDYAGIYSRGATFTEFLANARGRRDEWRDTYTNASLDEGSLARAHALKGHWRLLVVTDDSCPDSVNTVPYLAKLAEAVPGTISIRLVRSAAGEAVKEAHQTPDGRPATPTIVALDEDGSVRGVFVERPAALLEYLEQHGRGLYPHEVVDLRHKWYAEDHGRHAVAQILDMLEQAPIRIVASFAISMSGKSVVEPVRPFSSGTLPWWESDRGTRASSTPRAYSRPRVEPGLRLLRERPLRGSTPWRGRGRHGHSAAQLRAARTAP